MGSINDLISESAYSKINIKTILYILYIRIFGNISFNSFLNICLPIVLSIIFEIPEENRDGNFRTYVVVIIAAIVVFNLLFYIANVMKNKNEKWKNLLDNVIKHISAINIETANNIFRMHKHTKASIASNSIVDKNHYNKIADFQQLAFLVCKAVYEIISEQLGCDECEVTVYQKFIKEKGKKWDYVKMIAYATKDSTIPSTYETTYNINKNALNTVFMQLFKKTNPDPVILHKQKEIKSQFVFLDKSKQREEKICQYIGMPIKANGNNVICVLQVDVSQKRILGKNYKEVKFFADNVLKPFSSVLYNAYERDCVFNTLYEIWSRTSNTE